MRERMRESKLNFVGFESMIVWSCLSDCVVRWLDVTREEAMKLVREEGFPVKRNGRNLHVDKAELLDWAGEKGFKERTDEFSQYQ